MRTKGHHAYWRRVFLSFPSPATAAAYREAAQRAFSNGASRDILTQAYLATAGWDTLRASR